MAQTAARYPTPVTGISTPEQGGSPAASPRKRPRATTHSREWDTERASTPSSSRKEQPSKLNGTREREQLKARDAGPDVPSVSPSAASAAVRRFVTSQVAKEGFERAESPALYRLEVEVASCESKSL